MNKLEKKYIGRKYGLLKVVSLHVKYKNKPKWKCVCICGKLTIVSHSNLLGGSVKSCGCLRQRLRKKQFIGNKFNSLTVIGLDKTPLKTTKGYNIYRWKCRCDCGNITSVIGYRLTSGGTKSCGCKVRKRIGVSCLNQLYNKYRYRANLRKIGFYLSKTYFNKLIQRPCFYCGSQPKNKMKLDKTTNKKWREQNIITYNGVDRKDSKKGYYKSNCVAACKKCNIGKNQMSIKEFYEWVKEVWEWQQS